MKFYHVLSIASVLIFIALIFFSKSPKKFTLLFILYLLPVMDLPVTPVQLGSIRVFDCVSYISLFIFFKDIVLIKAKEAYNIYYLLFGLFALVVLLGSLNSQFMVNSLISVSIIFPIFIYAKLLITECAADKEFQKEIFKSLKIIALLSLVFLAAQMLVGLKFTFYNELNRNTISYGNIRYPSFFHDPQKYGQYLVLISFIFLINYNKGEKPEPLNYAVFLMLIIALLQTGGRTALIALLVGMVLLFFVLGVRYRLILASLALLSFVGYLYLSDSLLIFNRAKTIDHDYLFRASLWDEAYQFYLKKPVLGIGIGNYQKYAVTYSNNYYITPEKDTIYFDQPESGYIMIFTELGPAGAIITLLFFAIPIFNSIKDYLNGNRNIIGFLIIAAILSWLVTFFSVYSLNDKRILIIVVTFLSILIAAHTQQTPQHEA